MVRHGRAAVRAARLLFAVVGTVAIIDAATHSADLGHFFSFFTIESNILACLVLFGGGLVDPDTRVWSLIRAAATLYITITGIVYAALLAHEDVGLIAAWVNDVLHRAIPLVMVLDWALFAPWPEASYRAALTWLAAPAVFLAYSLIRGPSVHWYPYPFLDPRRSGGYARVAITSIALAVAMALLALAINWVGNRRRATQTAR